MTKLNTISIKLTIIFFTLILLISCIAADLPVQAATPAVAKSKLVLVKDYSSEFVIDLKYATYQNFVGKTLYPSPTCVLTKGTLDKLIKANSIVKKQGYKIKIWDAYRPLSVQKIMWAATPNKNYVANPYRSGSKHNRGSAVDVTLVDKTGKELKMPTGFDDFTPKASPNYSGITAEQKKNLSILTNAMTAAGFRQISTEWWHFDDTDYPNYRIQDIPLSSFDKTNYGLSNYNINKLKFIQSSSPSQLILVTSALSNSSYAVINTYQKDNNKWVNIHKNISAYIGKHGFSVAKTEGDKKTPVGVFEIGTCFSKSSGISTGLDFYRYDSKDVWVDDTNSAFYNTHQREPSNGRWTSAENFSQMKNGVYDVFFVIKYNTACVKNRGSAIFFHIANPTMQIKYTSGCVSTDRKNVLEIVKWLDKAKHPMILQGPLTEVVKY